MEKNVEDCILETLPKNCFPIFNRIVIIQQLSSLHLSTFGDMSEYILKRTTSKQNNLLRHRSVQRYESLKRSKRKRRAAGEGIKIQNILVMV